MGSVVVKTTAGGLVRGTLWNAAGQVVPVLVALVAIPVLVRGLGVDRFGVLALAWMIVGYLSFLDLGLGRALTKLVAEDLGRGTSERLQPLVWTGLSLMVGLGTLGGLMGAAMTPSLVGWILTIPENLQAEARVAFYLLSLSIPFVVATTGLRGVLEAYQRFDIANAIRIPLGMFNFIGPAVTVHWTTRIDVIVAVLVAGRIAAALAHYQLCRRVAPALAGRPLIGRSLVRPLVRFGGWMTISNVVGPVMVYFDRFLIGGRVSMSAVGFYVTPYEMITKLTLVPSAIVGVLFPVFSGTITTDPTRASRLLGKGVKIVFLALFPAVVMAVTFAHEGLDLWLGPEFAAQSARVLQWLAAGVFVNSLAQVPFAFLQGAGRPDLTAKLHFVELPFYLGLLWWAVQRYGIVGAAVVWTLRVAVDAIFIFWMAGAMLAGDRLIARTAITVTAALLVLLGGSQLGATSARLTFLVAVMSIYLPVAWRLTTVERRRFA